MSPTPYQINVPESSLQRLKERLSTTTFPSQFDGPDQWEFGAPLADVQKIAEYWRDDFDWKQQEAKLNELPMFMTKVDVDGFGDLDVHFLHQVSPVKGAIPLLFSHGWPGSFIEVTKMLPMLKGGGDGGTTPAFHVVAPSLPNFGFSSGVAKKGFTLTKYAETLHKLMLQLGYDKYVTQGGDWGFGVTRAVGLQYPEHCLASHINLVLAHPPKWTENPMLALQHAILPYSEREKEGRKRSEILTREGLGYNILQSTKPQTIGFALADSPVALLAWIFEKLHDWSDAYSWSNDEILTWVSMYWFSTAGPAASVRIYYEATHPQPQSDVTTAVLGKYVPHVKLGIAHFPREMFIVPHTWAATMGPVVLQSVHEHGGHFAAWEEPQAVVGDLRKMYQRGGPCFGIVKGKDGY